MGRKIHPTVHRLGVIKTWPSRWFGEGRIYINNLQEDTQVRRFLTKELREAGVDRVEIERSAKKIAVNVYTAKPGIIIGRGGTGAEDLKRKIHQKFLKKIRINDINLNITEVDRPNLSSQIVLQQMALDIEKRMPFRRVMKQALGRIERAGGMGAKVIVGGRLNGAEIARSEMLSVGKIPLQTLRADIDYSRGVANTTYGVIGIKVWIYKGEVFKKEDNNKGEIVESRKREGSY